MNALDHCLAKDVRFQDRRPRLVVNNQLMGEVTVSAPAMAVAKADAPSSPAQSDGMHYRVPLDVLAAVLIALFVFAPAIAYWAGVLDGHGRPQGARVVAVETFAIYSFRGAFDAADERAKWVEVVL